LRPTQIRDFKMKKSFFLSFGLLFILITTILVVNSCDKDITPSTFSGIVTYNGTPIQSAEVAIYTFDPSSPIQTCFTDKDGKYEMAAVVNGYTWVEKKGLFYDMWVKYEIIIDGYRDTYFSKRNFELFPGKHHTVNIPLEQW